MNPDALEKRIIQELQGSIPLDTLHPYAEIAQRCRMSEETLLQLLASWKHEGVIRRMGAVLRHQAVGRVFNAMSVWNVPDKAQLEEVVKALVARKEVSHCYERPTYPGWPYNLFGMIHCETREDCLAIAEQIARQTGVTDYRLLVSTKEYKKKSLHYF